MSYKNADYVKLYRRLKQKKNVKKMFLTDLTMDVTRACWIREKPAGETKGDVSPHRDWVSVTHRVGEAFLALLLPYRCYRSTD